MGFDEECTAAVLTRNSRVNRETFNEMVNIGFKLSL